MADDVFYFAVQVRPASGQSPLRGDPDGSGRHSCLHHSGLHQQASAGLRGPHAGKAAPRQSEICCFIWHALDGPVSLSACYLTGVMCFGLRLSRLCRCAAEHVIWCVSCWGLFFCRSDHC